VDLAEDLGVDSVWLAEYHFNVDRSVLSAPITVASAIAARTQRMRIGLAVHILPLANPVRVAEEVATLDHISRGRVEFGVGRGTFPNVHEGYGVPFHESRGRFEESMEVIRDAWTKETFSFHGKHFDCTDVSVAPRPYQEPHPPITVGITSVDSFPIIGEMGYPILINPSRVFKLTELEPHIQGYRDAWKKAGHAGEPKVGLRTPFYVAATEKEAYYEPRESAVANIRRLGERVTGLADFRGTTGDWGAEGQRILEMEYEDWLRDKVVFGTPDAAVEKINSLRKTLGLSQMMFEINFGSMIPIEHQRKSMKLIAEEVLPHCR
jgi:alkanesulfonate monooxygenase SsuD/methylene tetrahydromethanopterin reductase-like flavin-dependent oxidoreductase (luciferase family)